jgi:outer membrane protein
MRIIILFLGLVSILSVSAQTPLSLSDAIRLGLDRNYNIQIEQSNVAMAENNNTWGQAGRYPTINFNLAQNNGITDFVKIANPFAVKGQINANSISPSVNLNWVLFDGFSINMSKRRLEQLQAESRGNASIVISNTVQSIILGYYVAVLENQRLDAFQNQLKLSKDKYRHLETKANLGVAVTSELLLEEGNYLTDSVNFINQNLIYRNAIRNLKVLLSESDSDTEYVLIDSLIHDNSNYNFADLKEKMMRENVDLRKQYLSQSIMNTNTKIAQGDRLPTITLNAGLSENRGINDLSRTSFADNQRKIKSIKPDTIFTPDYQNLQSSVTDNYFANFTLSYTLFNGGKINRAIQNSMIQEDIASMKTDQMEISLERDLQSAFDRYQVRNQLYAINKRRVAAAKISLDISKEKYENGTINSFDYRIVQNNYLTATTQELQALYNMIDSKVEIMRLTGGILETYN